MQSGGVSIGIVCHQRGSTNFFIYIVIKLAGNQVISNNLYTCFEVIKWVIGNFDGRGKNRQTYIAAYRLTGLLSENLFKPWLANVQYVHDHIFFQTTNYPRTLIMALISLY